MLPRCFPTETSDGCAFVNFPVFCFMWNFFRRICLIVDSSASCRVASPSLVTHLRFQIFEQMKKEQRMTDLLENLKYAVLAVVLSKCQENLTPVSRKANTASQFKAKANTKFRPTSHQQAV